MKNTIFTLIILGSIIITTGCDSLVLKTVMGTVDPYFHGPGVDGTKFDKVGNNVYTYKWNWYRNLIIDTDDGLVIIDPMNPKMSAALKIELNTRFPGKKVHTLIYSHYHLDHTSGGSELSPINIVSHEKSPWYWNNVEHPNLVKPTEFISGDTVLNIGDVEIRALYLGLSHTDTLYAFHIPSERLVFTADVGLVKTVPPIGIPDRYAPGYLAAMDRIIEIDFDTFVPSHFGFGKKSDLIDWRNMIEDARKLSLSAIKKHGSPGVGHDQMGKYFDEVYYPMREKYSTWHGFSDMFVLNLVRDIVGESLGY
ncbi:MAG: MBL fold metallo-hydrolase [gamma proteobacterium symbiont of Taylorina sp.]|nr:MBL fold metallo-hydrolase [gamma proteobacterium symbiont of Taylorina sp.]